MTLTNMLIADIVLVILIGSLLFLMCDTAISFVLFLSCFCIVLLIINWYIVQKKVSLPFTKMFSSKQDYLEGEQLLTKRDREHMLYDMSRQ